MKRTLQRRKQRRGQTLVEYALILAFISIVAISVLISLGKTVGAVFSRVNSNLSNAVSSH
jgi:Flp pilus assembly pilin Flp